jgi:hypothetical protein
VSDVYDDIDLPFPDVKVAGKLCLGGPCKHVVKEGSGIMDAFLPEHIAPNIRTRFPDDVTIFLAKVLLWLACLLACLEKRDCLPQALRDRIANACGAI